MLTEEQILSTSEKDFMNPEQLEFMRQLLLDMRERASDKQSVIDMPIEDERLSDVGDRALREEQWMIALKKRSMQTDLLSDIDKALQKVHSGEYGYCEHSGEQIDIRRLLALPTSRMTVEEQQRLELQARIPLA